MKRKSGSENDKPTTEDLGRIPIDVKWDLTTAPPVFMLCNEFVKYHYLTFTSHNNNNNNNNNNNRKDVKSFFTTLNYQKPAQDVKSFLTTMLRDRQTRKNRAFLRTWATNYGEQIILHLWIYGATTPFELKKLYEIERQTANNNLTKLEGIDFVRKTITVHSGGKESCVYALTIADRQASIDAKIRHDELKKLERDEDKTRKRDSRRLAAEEMRRKGKAQARLKGSMIQLLVTEFVEQFENTRRPVSYVEIERRARKAGIPDYIKVAIELEEKYPESTGYYKDGELDPTILPPEIKQIREAKG